MGLSKNDLPLGFGMALAQNMLAMNAFALLGAAEQQEYVNKAHQVDTKDEMEALVNSILK